MSFKLRGFEAESGCSNLPFFAFPGVSVCLLPCLSQVQRDVLDDRKVSRCVIFSHAAIVILRRLHRVPVETVFNSPMRAYGMRKARGVLWQGRDEVSRLPCRFPATFPKRDDATHAGQTLPMWVTLLQPVDGVALGVHARFNPALIGINRLQ